MSSRLRSSSVGSKPRPRLHRPSRAESAQALALDVRCACQFFETKSLLPERVNPIGYNTAEEYEPCVHVHAILKNRDSETNQQSDSNMAFTPSSSNNIQLNVAPINAPQSDTNVCELPPEFASESMYIDNIENQLPTSNSNALGNRSASCANMGAQPPTPQLMKQRDPSTSSLLRKRMSEERQGFSVLNKRSSQSTSSRDQFTIQKDPLQSSILRRKLSNRSSGSFERASSEMASNENPQPFQFHQSRIPNERTFYHDSDDMIRNSNIAVNGTKMEVNVAKMEMQAPKVEIASPLSMQAQGNRRFMLSSSENEPQKSNESYAKTSIETTDSGIDSNYLDELPRKTDIEKQILQQNRSIPNRNVSDEEKVQILLSKTQNLNAMEESVGESKPNENDLTDIEMVPKAMPRSKPKPKILLMKADDVKSVEMPIQPKVQYQYVSKFDDTTQPQEAQTNDYSHSKIFDNYKEASNVSTPDLSSNYARQRDPSISRFTQNRYKTSNESTPIANSPLSMLSPMSMNIKTNPDKLLPSAGTYPERRASEICPSQQNPSNGPQFIRQKDLKTSNVLNRRRRNLSQSSLGPDFGMVGQPTKVTKTISFEKSLNQMESDEISPYTGTNVKIIKGVSFEFNRPLPGDRHERNTFECSHPSANKQPFR